MVKKVKYKFVAKPVSAIQKIDDSTKLVSYSNMNYSLDQDDIDFDLDKLNLSVLIKELSKASNKKFKTFHFLQKRENKRVSLKIEHIQLLKQALSEIRSYGKEILELSADNFLTTEMINQIVMGRRVDFEYQLKDKIEKYQTNIHLEKNKREESDIRIASMKMDLLLKTAEANEHQGYANFVNAMANDIANLSPGAKIYMWHDLINRHKEIHDTGNIKDFDFDEFLKNLTKDELFEALKRSKAKTTTEQAKADFEKHNTDRKTKKI
jgi:hypothetical protein